MPSAAAAPAWAFLADSQAHDGLPRSRKEQNEQTSVLFQDTHITSLYFYHHRLLPTPFFTTTARSGCGLNSLVLSISNIFLITPRFRRPYLSHCLMMVASGDVAFRGPSGLWSSYNFLYGLQRPLPANAFMWSSTHKSSHVLPSRATSSNIAHVFLPASLNIPHTPLCLAGRPF